MFWVAVFPGTMTVYLPWRYFGVGRAVLDRGDPVHWAGLGLIVLGAVLLGTCIWEFAHSGRGTLSPLDPPRELVVKGLYLLVVNLFVIGYEEPCLRRQFGESYQRYCRQVGRWIPF